MTELIFWPIVCQPLVAGLYAQGKQGYALSIRVYKVFYSNSFGLTSFEWLRIQRTVYVGVCRSVFESTLRVGTSSKTQS